MEEIEQVTAEMPDAELSELAEEDRAEEEEDDHWRRFATSFWWWGWH